MVLRQYLFALIASSLIACSTERAKNPVTSASCGDSVVQTGEQCDDGNTVDGDGCEHDCTVTADVTGTVCPHASDPPPASGTCSIMPGGTDVLITANLLGADQVTHGGQVLVDSTGRIKCVACDCSAMTQNPTTISCPNGVLSPGLINTHDHITYTQDLPATDSGERYEQRHDWREGKRGHTKIPSSGSATNAAIEWGELRFLMGGATSIVGSGGTAGLVRNLDKANLEEGLGQKAVDFDTFPLGDSNGAQLSSGCGYPAIATLSSIAADDAFFPHVSEGIDTVARNEFLCMSSTDNGGQLLTQPQSAFIHSVGLTAADYADMAATGTGLSWAPRSNIRLYGNTAQVIAATRMGVTVALGTDWMPTGSMNLLRELRCVDSLNQNYYNKYFSDAQLWQMVTGNAATITATDDVIGSLKTGLVADLAIFNGAKNTDYRAVLAANPDDVVLVMRGGKALYGDINLIQALPVGENCDTLDVCGTSKGLCVKDEVGMSYTDLQTAAGKVYAAFYCTDPPGEPTCLPTRPTAVNGSSVYTGMPGASDRDGDGIDDANDNCPDYFNPIRPVDNGAQADADSDGKGDICDPCPLLPNETNCPAATDDDSDQDGVKNADDNCVSVKNADQLDSDGDGKGDVCDACPTSANPGSAGCPASIYDIKKGTVPVGQVIAISNALVTASASDGYFLQVKTGDVGYQGAEYSGIFVTDTVTHVVAGNRIAYTSATVVSRFGQIVLADVAGAQVSPTSEAAPDPVTQTAAGVTLTATDVANGGGSAAALESVIVTVPSLQVTDIDPAPGAGDKRPTQEFVTNSVLRVNDLLFLSDPFPVLGERYDSITGILEYRNDNSKLEPRSGDDLKLGPPVLVGFGPTPAFVRTGSMNAVTLARPLTVTLSRAAPAGGMLVTISSDMTNVVVMGGGITVPELQTTAQVLLTGALAGSATLTASLNGDPKTAVVQVLDPTAQPSNVTISPATGSVRPNGHLTFTVTLDIPAPTGGASVALSATSGTVPMTVTVPADSLSATFDFASGSSAATVTATLGSSNSMAQVNVQSGLVINEVDYDQPGADGAEFIELYNPDSVAADLSHLSIVFVNGANLMEYGRVDLAGTLAAGGYLVAAMSSVTVDPGATRVSLPGTAAFIQNGNPDAVGILDKSTNRLLDALSYGGSITAGQVSGVTGTLSFVEGTAATVTDSNSAVGSLIRSPNGQDTDNAATDWHFTSSPTPGLPNTP